MTKEVLSQDLSAEHGRTPNPEGERTHVFIESGFEELNNPDSRFRQSDIVKDILTALHIKTDFKLRLLREAQFSQEETIFFNSPTTETGAS